MLSRAHQIVQLNRGDALIDTRDDLLGDGSSVNEFRVHTIAETGNTRSDLVKLYPLFAVV